MTEQNTKATNAAAVKAANATNAAASKATKVAAGKASDDKNEQEDIDFAIALSLTEQLTKAGAVTGVVTGGAVTGGTTTTATTSGAANLAIAIKAAAAAGKSVEDWAKIYGFGPEYFQ